MALLHNQKTTNFTYDTTYYCKMITESDFSSTPIHHTTENKVIKWWKCCLPQTVQSCVPSHWALPASGGSSPHTHCLPVSYSCPADHMQIKCKSHANQMQTISWQITTTMAHKLYW